MIFYLQVALLIFWSSTCERVVIYCVRGFIGVFLGDALRTFLLRLLCFLSNCIVQQIGAICLISPWFDACPLELGGCSRWGSCTHHHSWGFGLCQDRSDGAHGCWAVLPKVQCRHSSDSLHCTLWVPAAHVLYICHPLWQNSSIILATDLSEQKSAQPLWVWWLCTKSRGLTLGNSSNYSS